MPWTLTVTTIWQRCVHWAPQLRVASVQFVVPTWHTLASMLGATGSQPLARCRATLPASVSRAPRLVW